MAGITYEDFDKVEIRLGVVEEAFAFPEAKKPAFKLKINLGSEIGVKWSSAQITNVHTLRGLKGMQVLCVTNFPPKQIGPFTSEVLTLGVPDGQGGWVLITPSMPGGTPGDRLR